MKTFLTIIYAIACAIVLIIGNYYWTNKTTVQIEASTNNAVHSPAEDRQEETNLQLLPLTKNWPEQSVERFKLALEVKTPFKIVIVGSTALGGDTGWAIQTKNRLQESYGLENLIVEIMEFGSTSTDFINQNKIGELAALKGDMILLEPFILNDNSSNVLIDDSLMNLSTIIETIKQTAPDTVFLLQPSYPIFQAKRYPVQISELKNYAEANSIPFLDHWTAWPSSDSEEVKGYIDSQLNQPNEKGHQVWSEFISNYFISK